MQALAERIERLLRKAGRYLEDQGGPAAEPEPDDSLAREAAAGDGLLFGPHDHHAGKPALRVMRGEQSGPTSAPKLCAQVRGVNACVPARARHRPDRASSDCAATPHDRRSPKSACMLFLTAACG